MGKIIGAALIVLTLAGCAVGGDLPGDSAWSARLFQSHRQKAESGLVHRQFGAFALRRPTLFGASRNASPRMSSVCSVCVRLARTSGRSLTATAG